MDAIGRNSRMEKLRLKLERKIMQAAIDAILDKTGFSRDELFELHNRQVSRVKRFGAFMCKEYGVQTRNIIEFSSTYHLYKRCDYEDDLKCDFYKKIKKVFDAKVLEIENRVNK